jgi:hypothetical protein
VMFTQAEIVLTNALVSLKALLLFGLTKREQDAVYLQELAHKTARGVYPLPGRLVCKTAYLFLRGIGTDRLQALTNRIKSLTESGAATLAPKLHGNLGQSSPSVKTQLALVFLYWLVASCGDHNPITGMVHVWMFRCLVTIWAMFGKWCTENGIEEGQKLGMSSFFALFRRGSKWAHYLQHVKWKRQVTQKICSSCGGLMLERMQLFKDRVKRTAAAWLAWEARAAAHHALVFIERDCYHKLRARVRAGLAVSLYIMDASKPLRWPRRLFDSQAARAIPQLCGAFIGVLCHTTRRGIAFLSPAPGVAMEHKARGGKKARAAGVHYTWECSDVNCTLLLITLLHDYKSGRLHRHVHLQVDGGSDARGFLVVQLLALLVCLGIVERVTIASLIPGHTHEDIDAFFSRLWKGLKTAVGARAHRTWAEMMRCAKCVYMGWTNLTSGTIEASGVATIPFVWRLNDLFGQGQGHATKPCLSTGMKGLFGVGKDHASKPSKFVIEPGVDGLPVITAFLSSVDGAPVFSRYLNVPVFQFAPRLEALTTHDLSVGWRLQHRALVEALDVGNAVDAGYTVEQREEIRIMDCVFEVPPPDAFGPLDHARFQALLKLGYAPLKGKRRARASAPGGPPARVRGGAQVDSSEEARGAGDWQENEDENDNSSEPGEQDEADDEEGEDESVVGDDEPVYEIEDWMDRRFNDQEQCDEYYIKFVGWPEPEWTLSRRLNCAVPRKVDELFDTRSRLAVAEAKRIRKAASWRAAARAGGMPDTEGANDENGAGDAQAQPRRSKRTKVHE